MQQSVPVRGERSTPARPPRGASCPGSLLLLACLALAAAVLVLAPAALAKTRHDATLVHVGPSGLETYEAWTKKSATLVPGMTGSWYHPVLSPAGMSAVTIRSGRTDRAYSANLYAAVLGEGASPFELTFPDESGWVPLTSLLGWLDDYTAVFEQPDMSNRNGPALRIARDTRTGEWRPYDGAVTYPCKGRAKTEGDAAYSISVSKKQVMTIRRRATGKLIAQFKVPGSGDGRSPRSWHYLDGSISPDKKFIAYELWRMPGSSSRVTWRTYVCSIAGKNARSLKNGNGGFVWR